MADKRRYIRDRLRFRAMDAFAGLLDGPRAREAFLLQSVMDPPWSLRIQDEAPLTLVAMVHGDAWVVPDGDAPTRLAAGDVAIIRGPDPYTVADDPATVPQVVIHPGQVCMTLDGQHLAEAMHLGVRTWGNCADGATTMLTGTYQLHSAVSSRLLDALPPLVVLPGDAWDCPFVSLLADEIVKDDPGQEAVLDRLLDLLLIAALRAWFARGDAVESQWYRAYRDPVVGPRVAHAAAQSRARVDRGRARGDDRRVTRRARRGASPSSSASRRWRSSRTGD